MIITSHINGYVILVIHMPHCCSVEQQTLTAVCTDYSITLHFKTATKLMRVIKKKVIRFMLYFNYTALNYMFTMYASRQSVVGSLFTMNSDTVM